MFATRSAANPDARPKRKRLLEALGTRELSVGEIVKILGWPQPMVPKHLGVLKKEKMRKMANQDKNSKEPGEDNKMRKLFAFNMVTLDGLFEGPNGDISWHNVDDEFNEFAVEQTSTVAAILFGRVTYELMASYWPTPAAQTNDPAVANLMNTLPKVVFSRTLQKADWNNTRLIKDNIAEQVLKMKQEPGNDLAVFGSANLLSSLMRMNLVDEHRVMVNPVLIGRGTPLFKNLDEKVNLKLVKTRVFKSGNVLLYYQPKKEREG